jgi:hypothetical protein
MYETYDDYWYASDPEQDHDDLADMADEMNEREREMEAEDERSI